MSKQLDFIWRFQEELAGLGLNFTPAVGILTKADSMAISLLPGSRTIETYYDGAKDKLLNIEVAIKTKEQAVAIDDLQKVSDHVGCIEALPSANDSYTLTAFVINSEPFLFGQDEQNFWIMRFQTQAEIYIKGDD